MKKGFLSTILLIIALLVGLSLLLYPTVSDYWNRLHQSKAVVEYAQQVANLNNSVYDKILADASAYNTRLTQKESQENITKEELAEYSKLLNISKNGIMGYIEIPAINVSIPIYHGTDESALQVAVGHIEWSSLPIGGKGTHSVISGHRGLPSARLFTDLDELAVGDNFVIRVLDETITYEIDKISVVLPEENQDLKIVPEQDYCTLVTCTPYGINTHRLLVRGHRIENEKTNTSIRVTADAVQIESIIVVPLAVAPILVILLLWLIISTKKKHRNVFQKERV